MAPAIEVDNLGKCYRVNQAPDASGLRERVKYRTLRDSLVDLAKFPMRMVRRNAAGGHTENFWAVDELNFEVKPGEVVGVIGHNGAGKSTLLKILSRVTKPTKGRVTMRGRIGSLLEVGTGFHPELTGRENVFLYGSILGMTRSEIVRKFDEIVGFAEVSKFLDTPVKRYSSGMYVRLAFAVAAHLEPEILLVDEVLAVGDSDFQRKCVTRMKSISQEGRTVLFVSHNMAAVVNLCTRAIVLERGKCKLDGNVNEVVEKYVKTLASPAGGEVDLTKHEHRGRGKVPLLSRIRMYNGRGEITDTFAAGDRMRIELDFEPLREMDEPHFAIHLEDALGRSVFGIATYLSETKFPSFGKKVTVSCEIPEMALAPGNYMLGLSAGTVRHYKIDDIPAAVGIEVIAGDYYGNGRMPTGDMGQTLVRSRWAVKE